MALPSAPPSLGSMATDRTQIGEAAQAWRWRKRPSREAGLRAAVLILLILGLLGATWFALRERQAKQVALAQEQSAWEQLREAESARQQAERQLLRSEWLGYAGQVMLAQ